MKSVGTLLILLCIALPAATARGQVEPLDDPSGFVISADQVEGSELPEGRVVFLDGNVTIERGAARLMGERGVYREAQGYAVIFGDVHGVDGPRTIVCDTLTYYRDTDIVVLTGNASYADTSGVTEARRIELLRRENVAICTGDVVAVDHEGSFRLTSGRLVYDFDRQEARAYDGPVITTFGEEGEPDATLVADVIELAQGRDSMIAFGDAEIRRDELSTRSRVATIFGDDRMALEGAPVVEQNSDRLTGERILVFASEGRVSRVIATGNAGTSYHVEAKEPEEEPHRGTVSGDTLTMYFQEGEPVLVVVRGRATSEHFVGTAGEMNRVSARQIDVLFEDGAIDRAIFRGAASGYYVFASEAPEEGQPAPAGPPSEEPGAPEPPVEPAPAESPPADPFTGEPPPEDTPSEEPTEGAPAEESPAPEPLGPGPPIAGPALAETPLGEPAIADSVALDSVVYTSDQIDYYVGRNRILLTGLATAEYHESVLTADEIVFDPDDQVLSARGSPDLQEGSQRLVGESLGYDLEEQTGAVLGGTTTFEQGIYYGDRVIRQADGTLLVEQGVYTTCSEAEPHYRIKSHQMKIYLDDKAVAKPIILYVGEIPVFALPFFVFPIRTTRHSGFLIPRLDIGFSETRGRFIKNFGYFWAPSDYWDLSAWADYYDQTRWIVHAEARYKLRYRLTGSVETSFADELIDNRRRWDLKIRHKQEIGRNWSVGASGDFRSDATYASDSNQSIQDASNRSLHSQFWTRGRWSSLSIGVTLDRREELDANVIRSELPRINVSASQRPIVAAAPDLTGIAGWLSKTTYSWRAQAVNDRDTVEDETEIHQGIGIGASIRNTSRVLGWLNVTPRVDLLQNLYDRDKLGNEFQSRFTYSAAVSGGTSIYGTFFPRVGALEGLRHIIEPTASFAWTPDFDQYFDEDGSDRFPVFGGFGGTPREREALNLSLVNKLQAKLLREGKISKIDNLLRLSFASSYNFIEEEEPWSDLVSGLEFRPGLPFSFRWATRHDPYGWDLQSSSLTSTFNLRGRPPLMLGEIGTEPPVEYGRSPADEIRREFAMRDASSRLAARPWDASVTFRYSRGANSETASYWTEGSFAFSLTDNWRLNYGIHYDLAEQEVSSQEYTIYRDMHCWEAQFTSRYYEGEWQMYFQINVKELPEIQFERGERFLRRSVR